MRLVSTLHQRKNGKQRGTQRKNPKRQHIRKKEQNRADRREKKNTDQAAYKSSPLTKLYTKSFRKKLWMLKYPTFMVGFKPYRMKYKIFFCHFICSQNAFHTGGALYWQSQSYAHYKSVPWEVWVYHWAIHIKLLTVVLWIPVDLPEISKLFLQKNQPQGKEAGGYGILHMLQKYSISLSHSWLLPQHPHWSWRFP